VDNEVEKNILTLNVALKCIGQTFQFDYSFVTEEDSEIGFEFISRSHYIVNLILNLISNKIVYIFL